MPTTKTIREQRNELAASVREMAEKARAENRDFTPDEQQQIAADLTKVKAWDDQIRASDASDALYREVASVDFGDRGKAERSTLAKSIGEHFVNSPAYKELLERKSVTRYTSGTTEWAPEGKAETAPIVSTGLGQTQYGPVIPTYLQRPTVAGLLSAGVLSGTSLTYFVQGATTGAIAAIAENTEKPGLVFSVAPVSETLAKIAGTTKITDETAEDAPAVVSMINAQLTQLLALAEEAQLVDGTGTAPNIKGILRRSGLQAEASAAKLDNADALYRATTKIQLATGLSADGLVIHPTDYQNLRLAKDLNGQYYGGGPFMGPYGQGGVPQQPGPWGLPTVVTTAIAAGTALVGAFSTAGQVFRKGGVRVESTNSDSDDFRFNRIAIRIEERLLLAVYIPSAFVKVTFSAL